MGVGHVYHSQNIGSLLCLFTSIELILASCHERQISALRSLGPDHDTFTGNKHLYMLLQILAPV